MRKIERYSVYSKVTELNEDGKVMDASYRCIGNCNWLKEIEMVIISYLEDLGPLTSEVIDQINNRNTRYNKRIDGRKYTYYGNGCDLIFEFDVRNNRIGERFEREERMYKNW